MATFFANYDKKLKLTSLIYPCVSVVAGMASATSGNRGVPEAPGRPLSLAFTSRSVNLSWAPPFNADQVQVSFYLVQVRAGEETSWEEERCGDSCGIL